MFTTAKEKKNYLDGWITYALFLRNLERNKLSKNESIKYLVNFIKVNP